MKKFYVFFLLILMSLTSCAEEEIVVPVIPYSPTFTLSSGEICQSSPDSYAEILALMTLMVEGEVMEMKVPYYVNLLDEGLYDPYEYAYNRAYQNVNSTHMEFTSNTAQYHIGYSIDTNGSFFMTFSRSDKNYSMEEILEQNRIFAQEVDILFNELVDSGCFSYEMEEMEQIKVFYDFTMERLSYDFTFRDISFTAYGAVTDGEVVCQGYVALFNALLKKAGFFVEGVVGESTDDGQGHIWSRVKLGEEWHYFDPTYGDRPTYSPEEGDLLYNYTYFDMSQDVMLYDRKTTYYLVNDENLVLPPP